MSEATGHVLGPGAGEVSRGPVGGDMTFKVRGAQSGDRLTVFENVIPPGGGPPVHTHETEDELVYVLEGELRFLVGDVETPGPAGSLMYAPQGVPHAFVNVGATDVRALVLFTSPRMESFFDALARLQPGDDPRAAFGEHGPGAGMTVVAPPMTP